MSIRVNNPATGEFLYEVTPTPTSEMPSIFGRARDAQKQVARLALAERITRVVAVSDYLVAHQEQIIDRLVRETGKTRFDALSTELFEICDLIDYYRDAAPKILKDQTVHTPIVLMGKTSRIVFEPLGVVLVISPWNYPLYQCFVPSLLAFLAGNAVVYKPSEVTPLQGLYEEIMNGAGFPQDAIQVVYGGKETGAALIEQRPDKIHFTGSVRGGKAVMASAAKNLIPVDLELGGKDPAIVFEDVDIERTANGIVWSAFTNAGQSCTSMERCYVHANIYDTFVEKVVDLTIKLRVSGVDSKVAEAGACDVGCMTAGFQLEIIEAQLAEAVSKGATILVGGKRLPGTLHFPPTVVVGVTHAMKLMTEETFGPILPVMKFTTEDEAVELANDSPYGLSASVWSKDLTRAERVARAIRTGNVSINNHMLTEGNPALPFGGVKDSGFGRYKGDWGLLTFSNVKSLILGPNKNLIETHWYPQSKSKYDLMTRLMRTFFTRPRKWLAFLPVALKLDSIGNEEKIK
ncbi:MAG: aldehyde dehydrogenase family protein [Chloroflexi bacterium]|nr:aldehyde dehydrogenase family protein [Chloroflexota bacterium]